ncbi:MAG: ketoacyl-synthetase C-terminal extension domain-containing protein, partial [Steroidobacteraceae bacterium]
GVASVIKVLLQLRHRTLVKSLHCEELNPHIALHGSPFYIVQENRRWPNATGPEGQEMPRRAGVSSFGFGGVNAHVVLEEYRAAAPEHAAPTVSPEKPALIVLSAKTEECLRERARLLLEHLTRNACSDSDLSGIAYTLQVGRDAMECRLAFTATDVAELQQKLSDYVKGMAGPAALADLHTGRARSDQGTLSLLSTDRAFDGTVEQWLQAGKYSKLLALWVRGMSFDWSRLYGTSQSGERIEPSRVVLPTYPFARERYWPKREFGSQPLRASPSSRGVDSEALGSILDDLLRDELEIEEAVERTRKLLPEELS